MTDEKKLNDAIYLLSEALTWSLFERKIRLCRELNRSDLYTHEIQALKFLSKNMPDKICLALYDFMKDNGYLKRKAHE